MPMNRVQFQPGRSTSDWMDRYGTEERCEAAVAAWSVSDDGSGSANGMPDQFACTRRGRRLLLQP